MVKFDLGGPPFKGIKTPLTTIVDRQFKGDRTLCPTQVPKTLEVLDPYLSPSRKDRPANLSLWLKQTILLCYKQAGQQSLDLIQVKAPGIRAFTTSKAFYSRISVD